MESRDLNNDPDEARLEAWLHSVAGQPPLPDDGFSARVMDALPPASSSRSHQRRLFILCSLALAAGAIVTFLTPLSSIGLSNPLAALGDAVTRLAGEAVSATGTLVVAGTIGSLAVAYWRELRSLVNG